MFDNEEIKYVGISISTLIVILYVIGEIIKVVFR
jgi:hypothetical protein